MDKATFQKVVSSFLDSEDQLQIERGTIVLQFGPDLINANLRQHDGALFVEEDGFESRAEQWIMRRIANLDLLAERIISSTSIPSTFVTPRGDFLDELTRSPKDETVQVDDAGLVVEQFVSRRLGGTCSV